ncbi:ATPase [Methylovirgula ligni]|uniref:RecA-family ATPase n=1 Tax=Methylovirgula ligni TaxID=569860 RepID=A0A3D9Z5S9_9HYPH|nr:AAA family ATPase [Methylovirgula ligni]QAY95108.1 ATPase [Methylovirgula ligni]REF89610.1 RecA-family ATPase [Methylovirgula ligni]
MHTATHPETKEPSPIRATPFEWIDPSDIPLRGEDLDFESEFPEYEKTDEDRGPANDNNPQPESSAGPQPEPLLVINPTDWQGQPVPERQWLLPGLIPSRTVTLLSGDGGTGKTLLALQIGMATALDCAAWGDTKPSAGRCLYIGAEDEPDEFHRRMVAILEGFGRSFSELSEFRLMSLADRDALLMAEHRGKLTETPLLQPVIDEICAFMPALVVLDTSVDFFGGDEVKRVQVKQFVGALHRLAMTLDCAVLLLSHPSVQGMTTGTGLSGSTAWNGAVRSRLYLTAAAEKDADPDARVLTTMKANFGPKGGKIALRWDRGRFVADDGTQTNPARAILDKRTDGIFLELLSKLTRQGRCLSPSPSQLYAPTVMAKHPDAKGVSKSDLTGALQRLLDAEKIQIVKEGPPSKLRSRLIVASENFGPDRVPSN